MGKELISPGKVLADEATTPEKKGKGNWMLHSLNSGISLSGPTTDYAWRTYH
jgi:hypothetical protein